MDLLILEIIAFPTAIAIIVLIWIITTRYYFILFRTPHWSVKLLKNMRYITGKRFHLDEPIEFKKYGAYSYPEDSKQIVEIGNIKLIYYDIDAKDALQAKITKPLYWDRIQPRPQQIQEILHNTSIYTLLHRRKPMNVNMNSIIFTIVAIVIIGVVVYYVIKNGGAGGVLGLWLIPLS